MILKFHHIFIILLSVQSFFLYNVYVKSEIAQMKYEESQKTLSFLTEELHQLKELIANKSDTAAPVSGNIPVLPDIRAGYVDYSALHTVLMYGAGIALAGAAIYFSYSLIAGSGAVAIISESNRLLSRVANTISKQYVTYDTKEIIGHDGLGNVYKIVINTMSDGIDGGVIDIFITNPKYNLLETKLPADIGALLSKKIEGIFHSPEAVSNGIKFLDAMNSIGPTAGTS